MLWELFRLQSGWSGQELGSPFLLCDMCQAFRGMGKMFTLYAFHHSYGLERDHGPCFRLLLLPVQYHWCNSDVQTHGSILKFIICDEASTSSAKLIVPKPPTNMTLSDSEWSDEDVGQANNNMDCDPILAGASSSDEPHLLTQGGLNDIVRDLNLSKKQAELLGSRLKGWNHLRQDINMCFTVVAMKNSRIPSHRNVL